MGWHFKRVDFNVGYAFVAPTGRFVPGASDNVGSGYWGNDITSGTTYYVTKNKGTTANLFTDFESHRQKTSTNLTPGQAFTLEWVCWANASSEKRLQQTSSTWPDWVRPVARYPAMGVR